MAGAKQAPLNGDHGHDRKEVALKRACSIPTESDRPISGSRIRIFPNRATDRGGGLPVAKTLDLHSLGCNATFGRTTNIPLQWLIAREAFAPTTTSPRTAMFPRRCQPDQPPS